MVDRRQRFLLYVSQSYAVPVLRPLQEAIRAAGDEAAWFFDGPGAELLREDDRRLERVADVKAFDPSAVFVPGNRVPDFFPGVKVEVFHGFSVGKRSDSRGHFRIRGLFDLYCTQGRTTTPQFQELARRHGYFRVVETGWPKTDPLFREPQAANPWREDWKREGPIVLFASTFTPSLSAAPRLRRTIRELSERGPYNWLVTLHPKMSEEVVQTYRALQGPRLRFADTAELIPMMLAADVMVSDTSSVVHEFLLQHKPVVTLRNARPGPYLVDIREPGELEPAIGRALRHPPELMQAIAEFADEIHPYRDGRSSERVLRATRDFIENHRGKLKRKPLNLWRRIQLRHRLGYYRWS